MERCALIRLFYSNKEQANYAKVISKRKFPSKSSKNASLKLRNRSRKGRVKVNQKERKLCVQQSSMFLSKDIDNFINVNVNIGMNRQQSQSCQPNTLHGVAKVRLQALQR
jgi:hypothetical protein